MNDQGSSLSGGPNAAALEHLTGRSRGSYGWITGAMSDVWLDETGRARMVDPNDQNTPAPKGQKAARISRSDGGFDIIAAPDAALWVNRKPVRQARLSYGDMIEFGENGPLSRFRIYDDRVCPDPTVSQIMGDAVAYMRSSRQPVARRGLQVTEDTLRRLIADTTLLFRGTVIAILLGLVAAVALNYRAGQRLRAELERGDAQVEAIAAELAQARRDSIRQSDLNALRDSRLETLEARNDAGTRVIAEAAGSVAFLQAGYGLRHRGSGKMLRHVLGPGGVPMMTPGGQPLLDLDGTGPVAEVQITGTGFLISEPGRMVTNRHVALPWESNPALRGGDNEMEPVMTRFIAYFPSRREPVELKLLRASDTVDLALLDPLVDDPSDLPAGLRITVSDPVPGQAVLVLGYPTGLMSLLAQAGQAFVDRLQSSGETGFWQVSDQLARADKIYPLASRGIVGQATGATVVYDAETTHGGSGGPVLDLTGAVVAVNTAIIPEFGGANLGVPARDIRSLLEPDVPSQ